VACPRVRQANIPHCKEQGTAIMTDFKNEYCMHTATCGELRKEDVAARSC
jgi:aspartyl-tRNA synthetase (EC 6.1.1.12)